MRGSQKRQASLFSYISLEQRVPNKHPLRDIRKMVDRALEQMHDTFADLYSHTGRPSIPPEYLLRASLLQVFYTIRSERLLMEQLDYNLLYRWFVGLSMDDSVWDHSVFSKNRDRLLNTGTVAVFFSSIRDQAKQKGLISDEHFTVDGTLLEAWASMKSFRPKDDDSTNDGPAATQLWILQIRNEPTIPMHPRPIRVPGYTKRAKDSRPSCVTWAMR